MLSTRLPGHVAAAEVPEIVQAQIVATDRLQCRRQVGPNHLVVHATPAASG
jgi:hypothetical protein